MPPRCYQQSWVAVNGTGASVWEASGNSVMIMRGLEVENPPWLWQLGGAALTDICKGGQSQGLQGKQVNI